MRRNLITLILTTWCMTALGEDNALKGWPTYHYEMGQNWPTFQYPPDFSVDPSSFGGPTGSDEGTHRSCVLTSKTSKLQIRASNYGFISDIYGSPKGFDSPRDILIAGLSNNPHYLQRIDKTDYEIFYDLEKTVVCVYFLKKNPDWGQCYETLVFNFPSGTLDEHRVTMDKVVQSFHPGFMKSKKAPDKK